MTTEEHLQKIKAKCQQLLALAEKRTPGRWNVFPSYRVNETSGLCIAEMESMTDDERDTNAAFIAASAGPAEAGWRATIAAVDLMLVAIDYAASKGCTTNHVIQPAIEVIVAAWPEELLEVQP